ncbi:TetR/AcrR family transcriptional regulator [Novosphingobium sp. ST904]|uniref:TetR/AcrR family transcriptional regulator n=1 Tax=Novosphingobium sp. ST904 TaxID=1684385 RepID=UPI0006C8396E|nr:TetR/AcrR family transcriptional regulator [Novosphingobium sp. ST904]KPH62103.1 transcriptional regulator [Novosphingobium sp. ST904]TCM33178.1 TetR family transcriptional regulator [Novosphingobium sp. ST904]
MTREHHLTARGSARLEVLTDTAAALFLERGYEAVSLDELIARAGGSRRNIYSHFGGKEGLFIEVVTRLCREISEPLEALGIGGDDIRTALIRHGRALLQTVLQPRTLALHRLMIAEGQRFPELAQAVWHAGHDNAARTLAPSIERWRGHAGVTSTLPSDVLAAQFVDLVVGGPQLRALVGLESLPLPPSTMSRYVDEGVETFLCGILPRKDLIHA